jgi:hypothetical protein
VEWQNAQRALTALRAGEVTGKAVLTIGHDGRT